jgi:hypothetical protein
MKSAHSPAPISPYERDLSRRVLECEPDSLEAGAALFDSLQPATLAEAVGVVSACGELTPEAFDCVTLAFDRYWHLRDMPCN